jgi:hypothetical protein
MDGSSLGSAVRVAFLATLGWLSYTATAAAIRVEGAGGGGHGWSDLDRAALDDHGARTVREVLRDKVGQVLLGGTPCLQAGVTAELHVHLSVETTASQVRADILGLTRGTGERLPRFADACLSSKLGTSLIAPAPLDDRWAPRFRGTARVSVLYPPSSCPRASP